MKCLTLLVLMNLFTDIEKMMGKDLSTVKNIYENKR